MTAVTQHPTMSAETQTADVGTLANTTQYTYAWHSADYCKENFNISC